MDFQNDLLQPLYFPAVLDALEQCVGPCSVKSLLRKQTDAVFSSEVTPSPSLHAEMKVYA